MRTLYDRVSLLCSKITTKSYSTSFSLGIKLLNRKLHDPIYAIYGFVRLADEIVDSLHEYDKEKLLLEFKKNTYQAIQDKISLNPILNSFQKVVNKYKIEPSLIEPFFLSMEMDLEKKEYNQKSYEMYIYGSAQVVGLMCLKVFCKENQTLYKKLEPSAKSLGAAFQKINFLRDMCADYQNLGRTYFPNVDMNSFDEQTKKNIEEDIKKDFQEAYKGIKQLPQEARLGVYLAYVYYFSLFKKIKKTSSINILKERIRITNPRKYALLIKSYFQYKLKLL